MMHAALATSTSSNWTLVNPTADPTVTLGSKGQGHSVTHRYYKYCHASTFRECTFFLVHILYLCKPETTEMLTM